MLTSANRTVSLTILRTLAIVTAFAALADFADAQTSAQIPLQFDFLNPGARSLGMGSAFIAAADDATAAFANPAGLASLKTREILVELRSRHVDTPFLRGGRISGVVTGMGLDTIAGPAYGTDGDGSLSPAFLSFVQPLGQATIAGYFNEMVRIDNSFFSDGPFERESFLGVENDANRDPPIGGSRSVIVRNYGAAVGWKPHERFAIGGVVSAYTFDLDADFARYTFVSDVFSPSDRSGITATATQTGDAFSLRGGVGVQWLAFKSHPAAATAGTAPREPTTVKIGANYRKGPSFSFSQHDVVRASQLDLTRTGTFKVPDVTGIGAEWKLNGVFRVTADYNRVSYAQLKKDFIDIQSLSSGRQDQLHIDSGNEVHAGFEYLVLNLAIPLAVRGGAWYDPDHSVHYEPTAANDRLDVLLAATLPGTEGLVHYTFGAGVVLPWHGIEVNGAGDFSSRTRYLTASCVLRF